MSIKEYNEQLNNVLSRTGESWSSILSEKEEAQDSLHNLQSLNSKKYACSDIIGVNPLNYSSNVVKCNSCKRVVHILAAKSHMVNCQSNQIAKKETVRKEVNYIPDSEIEPLINPFLNDFKEKLEEPKKYETSYDSSNIVKYKIREANDHSKKAESSANVDLFVTKPDVINSNGNNRVNTQRRPQQNYRSPPY